MHLTISQLLATGRAPEHPVALRAGSSVSFFQFGADVAHNAARLRAATCRTGAPLCRDGYWFMVGFLALCHAGAAIIIPSNTQPGTVASLSRERCLLLVDPGTEGADGFQLEEGGPDSWRLEPFDASKIGIDFFTSGSTGAPKRITRTVRLLEQEVNIVSAALDSAPVEGLVSGMVPYHHVYGMIFRLLWPLSCGRPFSSTTHEVWETLLDELEPDGVLVTSPAHLSRLSGVDAVSPSRIPGLILSAGAPLPYDAACDAARLLGIYPTEIFGSTETGACGIRQTKESASPWRPLPGVQFGLTAGGTLKVRSPAVASEAWTETADLVDLLPDGGFQFRGRADRIVKIEGKRVSLPGVENDLSRLPWVDSAAVIMVEHPRACLGAAIVVSRDGKEKLAELGEFRFSRLLRRELTRTQEPAGLPRRWRFVRSLPVGDMGKRKNKDLANLFVESPKS